MKNDFQSSMVRTAALQTLPVDELRALWDKHVPRQPELSRNYLETRLSYQFEKMTYDDMQAVMPQTQIEAEAIPGSPNGCAQSHVAGVAIPAQGLDVWGRW